MRILRALALFTSTCLLSGITACGGSVTQSADSRYAGAYLTVRSGFTEAGEPSTTSCGTVHFGESNRLDGAKTEYLRAGSDGAVSSTEPPKQAAAGRNPLGAPLVFGMLMTRPSATQIANHKANGVHVLIGTSGSGVAAAVIPEIRRHGLIMISPSNTAATLSTVEDDGLYFRTAPSDVLQARALADMIMRDGAWRVTLIGRKDACGTGLVDGVRTELLATGMTAGNIQTLGYQIEGSKVKDAAELGSLARQTLSFHPDGVLVVGLTESADMIKALADAKLVIRH